MCGCVAGRCVADGGWLCGCAAVWLVAVWLYGCTAGGCTALFSTSRRARGTFLDRKLFSTAYNSAHFGRGNKSRKKTKSTPVSTPNNCRSEKTPVSPSPRHGGKAVRLERRGQCIVNSASWDVESKREPGCCGGWSTALERVCAVKSNL